jgi:transcriptional regulator with XRE-family HTH domain
MPRNVNDIINKLTRAQRRKVEARAAQLIAEEMTLQELRRARKITQQKIANSLNIGQEGVSKIERRSDLLISTLRRTVEAMGGSLSLVAEFPDRDPVILSGVGEDEPTKTRQAEARSARIGRVKDGRVHRS